MPREDELSLVALNGTGEEGDESTPSSGLSSVGDALDKIGAAELETTIKLEGSEQPSDGLGKKKNGLEEPGPGKEAVKAGDDAMDLT